MNYFAHGYRFIDRPYFLAGTAVPDWLRVSDPRVRIRAAAAKLAADRTVAPVAAAEPAADLTPTGAAAASSAVQGTIVRAIAQGIAQHHEDDAWFHSTPAFAELSANLSRVVREALGADEGLRSWFLGHLLVELLLDAALIYAQPQRLEAYYAALADVDPELVQRAVNLIAPRQAERLAAFVTVFLRERFLFDYLHDGKLAFRIEQVLRRAGLPPAGPPLLDLLPVARSLVSQRATDLVTPPGPATLPHATPTEIGL